MPLLEIHRLAPCFTEYRVTANANKYGLVACIVLFAQSIVSTVRQLDQAGTSFKLLAVMFRQPWHGDFSFWCRFATSLQLVITCKLHIDGVWLVQITCWVAAIVSAYCWAYAARYESVTVVKGLALQLQCTLRCGVSNISCYDIEQVKDILIWEVRTVRMLTVTVKACMP